MSTAVVTGLGVLAANGNGVEEYWEAALRGESGIGLLTRFDPTAYPARLAAEVKDFMPKDRLPSRLLPQTDHLTRLSLVAAAEAFADAGIDPKDMADFTAGIVTANSGGGFDFGQRELEALWSKGGAHVSAYQSFAWFYPVNTGQISIRHGMRGPGSAVVSEQAGGLDAVAKARREIGRGTALMLAGAIDGALCPWSWVCMLRSGRVSTSDDPSRAYLPFQEAADGYVPGEGGALLVLEDEAAATARGVSEIYGRVAGYAATFDPRPGSPLEPGLGRAIELALDDAGLRPDEIDVVFADAAGIPELDRIEATTLATMFGPRGVPVTAPKTMTGRLLAGGAALDVATALLSMRDSVIPPTVHCEDSAYRDGIDLVTAPRQTPVRSALVIARGYGGFNSAMVLRHCR